MSGCGPLESRPFDYGWQSHASAGSPSLISILLPPPSPTPSTRLLPGQGFHHRRTLRKWTLSSQQGPWRPCSACPRRRAWSGTMLVASGCRDWRLTRPSSLPLASLRHFTSYCFGWPPPKVLQFLSPRARDSRCELLPSKPTSVATAGKLFVAHGRTVYGSLRR